MAPKKAKPKKARCKKAAKPQAAKGGQHAKLLSQLDAEMLELAQNRARLVLEMSESGIELDAVATASGIEEDQVLDSALQMSPGPLPLRAVRGLFRELLSGCRALIRTQRIAFLGPLYSFSHLAALRRFGQSVEFVPVGSIQAVFEEINRGHSDFGLVPVENSTDGRIADTLDMFTKLTVQICGQVDMEIHHTLLGSCPRDQVQEVYSKTQVLSQCRNWLAKHLPGARTIEVTSTSMAAQLAKEKPGAAAIASMEAGIHHGLEVLAERIEDNPGNTTRFAVIGKVSAPQSGNDRTAMLFQVEHRPGALAEAMNIFKRNEVNLTWIESFPIPGSNRTYLFFVEMEGHRVDSKLQHALDSLKKKAIRLEILGSYPVAARQD